MRISGRTWVRWAALFVLMPWTAAAQPVLSDDFNDNTINASVWTIFRQGSGPAVPSVTEVNQRLEMTLPAQSANDAAAAIFSARYVSACRLRGDFDMQVDYVLLDWPTPNGVRIGLKASAFGVVARISGNGPDGFREVYATDFTPSTAILPTADLSGKLRLSRTGTVVSGFQFSGGNWVLIGSRFDTSAADTDFEIVAWSHDGFFANLDVRVAFDNFAINLGQLTCPANAGPDQTVNEGATVTLDGSQSGGTNITFEWVQLAGPAVTLNGPTTATPAFTAPMIEGGFGSQVLTFQVKVSSDGLSSTDTVDVTVKNVNHAPVADAGSPQTVNELTAVTLNGTASFDPDGDAITHEWRQISGAPVTLQQPSSPRPTFQAPQLAGGASGFEVLIFELTVSDGTCATCLSDTAWVTITVEQVNHAPAANAGDDQTKNEGTVVALDGSGSSDPDGDPLHYAWTQIGGPLVQLSDAAGKSPSFTAPVTGSGGAALVFRLVVSDSELLSPPDEVTVNVVNVNDPPRCELARASPAELWPPNHKLIRVGIVGVTDANSSDAVSIAITAVTQDEPVDGLGDGDTSPDAMLQGSHALLRAERAGAGNGRVYHVHFTATDNQATGGSCNGAVTVSVPHSIKPGLLPLDDGQVYDSTRP